MTTTQEEPLHLLDLPHEILAQILAPLLEAHAAIPVAEYPPRHCFRSFPTSGSGSGSRSSSSGGAREDDGVDGSEHSTVLSVLLIHPRIHSVVVPILYGLSNEFLLDLSGPRHVLARREFEEKAKARRAGHDVDDDYDGMGRESLNPPTAFQDDDGDYYDSPAFMSNKAMKREKGLILWHTPTLRRLRRLTLKMDRMRGWMSEHVIPLVKSMILRGQLTHLDVILSMGYSGPVEALVRGVFEHRNTRGGEVDVGGGRRGLQNGRGPGTGTTATRTKESMLAEFLLLLADPYIQRGRLFFVKSKKLEQHGNETVGVTNGSPSSTPAAAAAGNRGQQLPDGLEGDILEEIDWKAIMAESSSGSGADGENHQRLPVATRGYGMV